MPANININSKTNKASFFSRKEIAWHGLGTIIDKDYVTAEEAIDAAGLNFTVTKEHIFIKSEEGKFRRNSNYFATVRQDTKDILGIVGKDYEVVQNVDCFNFIDNIIMGSEASFETAGALGLGEKVFVTAKLPSVIKLGDNDDIEKYVFITTSHDGLGKITAAVTPIRIVCNNTLNLALQRSTNKVSFKHTRNVKDKLDMAQRMMGITNKYYEEFQDLMMVLKNAPLKPEEVLPKTCKIILSPSEFNVVKASDFKYETALEISTRKANIITDVMNTIESGVGQNKHRGTGLWLLNGITSYYQNTKSYRTDEAKLISLTDGRYSDIITQAVPIILENY